MGSLNSKHSTMSNGYNGSTYLVNRLFWLKLGTIIRITDHCLFLFISVDGNIDT